MRYCSARSLALVVLVFIVSLSDEKVIAPDNKKLYHDIVSGLGLYNNFEKIYELTTSNFKNIVYNTDYPKTWLVEFYNSWCGHCHRFAPIYKGLAVDVYNWRDVVGIGAVDCANDKNNQLCRDYEIMAYPSLKIFPIYSPDTFLGDTFPKGSVSDMRLEIAKQIHAEDSSGRLRQNLNLRSFNSSDLNILWFNVPLEIQNIFLVFQHPLQTPHLGSEVALDLYPVKSIQVRIVNSDNNGLMLSLPVVEFPTVYVIERNNNHYNLLQLRNSGNHRDDIYYAIKEYLAQKGVNVPVKESYSIKDLEFDVADVMKYMKTQEEIKKKLQAKVLADVVFQVDLEGALKYSLYHEISGHKNIDGEKLVALKDYLTILSKYFPIGNEGKQFLESLRSNTEPKSIVYGQNFSSYAKTVESMLGNDVFLPDQNWIGCQGSQPHFRGYPCSLWKLFHTLTVQADSKKYLYPAADSQEVLNAMVGYIRHFFGCSDCSQHFQQMAVTMSGNVSSIDTSILWLWQAHNAANARLHGDATEDPEHQKVQFPSQESCPKCRQSDSDNWKIPEVLDFLKSMYTNISYIQWSDISDVNTIPSTSKPLSKVLYSKSLRHESYGNENGFESHDDSAATKSSWDFNIFDISLCVVLYVTSVVILLLVCIKFVMKKSYKKKNSFDLYHSKV